ncbi:MAG TPA: coenzyme F420-0:L-glutamate ligase [Sedimentisphaerales bacterium]|nr:coenzyme F420-0:L-glutamate ligase [Sedimentisphaerales bacterium]
MEQSLFRLLDRHVNAMDEGTVLAVTSKLVALCQGRFFRTDAVDKQTLIEREADVFLPPQWNRHHVVLTITGRRLIPSAGIDESNGDGHYLLWPERPQCVANAVRAYLRDRFSLRDVGVLITDSTTAPLRCGVNGMALAHSGFLALNDYVGAEDVFGRPLRLTKVNVAEALAAAAVLVMGEGNEQTPLSVITELPFVTFQDRNPTEAELEALRIQPEDDLYAPLLQAVRWRAGRNAKQREAGNAQSDCVSAAQVSSCAGRSSSVNQSPATVFEAATERVTAPWRAAHIESILLLGVDYLRLKTGSGELYLTRFGVPFQEQLAPENWYAPDWFAARRTRLPGTSTIYRVPTKPVGGVGLNLVVRFSRVGQEVPLDTRTVCQYPHVEFNSPFEEFSLVVDVRTLRPDLLHPRILTKRPLAIFVPAERLQPWETGRREYVFAQKEARHPDAGMDICRQYILVYGWIKGVNAVQAAATLALAGRERDSFLADVTLRASHDLQQRGFRMLDMKPDHIIVRIRPDGSFLRRHDGQLAYALVDYELLERSRK